MVQKSFKCLMQKEDIGEQMLLRDPCAGRKAWDLRASKGWGVSLCV